MPGIRQPFDDPIFERAGVLQLNDGFFEAADALFQVDELLRRLPLRDAGRHTIAVFLPEA